ncbi:hypothetical protein CTA1_8963 [Colletotrichum tanaceti]|uniref:Uncharacterized protein n=1 Tax=Colletotrichum tanaceti TaxID=1306861 RepID=A0A4U6X207_9PEZI|nr:hypothetical protein CTA1_8963 [Colletotrichum tanaceti]
MDGGEAILEDLTSYIRNPESMDEEKVRALLRNREIWPRRAFDGPGEEIRER